MLFRSSTSLTNNWICLGFSYGSTSTVNSQLICLCPSLNLFPEEGSLSFILIIVILIEKESKNKTNKKSKTNTKQNKNKQIKTKRKTKIDAKNLEEKLILN